MTSGIDGLVNIGNGLAPDDSTGDSLRTGADKINGNTAAIAAAFNALAAAQAAGVSGVTYATTAAGLSATPPGKYFSVPSADANGYLDLWLNNAGVAAFTGKTYPSSVLVDIINVALNTIAAGILPDKYLGAASDLYEFSDAAGKIVGRIRADAGWDILLNSIKSTTGLEVYEYQSLDGDGDNAVALVDATGKVLARFGDAGDSTEVVAARGTRADVNTRISQSLNPYGSPIHHYFGEWYLRETRQRLRKRLLGESARLTVAMVGDSWTHLAARYSGPTASTLKATFGDAGPGWLGFGYATPGYSLVNGNVGSDAYLGYTGTWTAHYSSSTSPDICDVYSSTATDKLTVTHSSTANLSAVNLYYIAGAGAVQYRWNGGGWNSLDLSTGSGLTVASLASVPTGAWTLEIANVSGTTTLCGVDLQSAADGVRVHKLGATGSRASQWAAVNATQWEAGLLALAPNLVTILLATNDQSVYDAIAFSGYVQTMIDRVRAVTPLADILLVCPCENGRGLSNLMSTYASAMYQLATVNKCAFLDLQYMFGESYSQYAPTSPRAWFASDTIHPDPNTGGRVIVDALIRLLTQN